MLQASWSFERMQSVGFAALMAGEGRRLTKGRPAAAAPFLARQLTLFNTNPPLAGYLAGVLLRLEEEVARNEVDHPEQAARTIDEMRRFKRAAVSAFAAWGDRFFWGTLRPAATALGVLLVLLAGAWGALAWLIVYNAAHLHHRYHGLSDGYRLGTAVASRVAASSLRRLPDRIRPIGLVAVGALVPVSLVAGKSAYGLPISMAFLATGLVMALVLHRRGGLGWGWGFLAVLFGFAWALLVPGR